MEDNNAATIKEEQTDDYTYEYQGAPSPESPVYDLIPLQDLSQSQRSEKESFVDNNNYVFNMGQLETQYASFRNMVPNPGNDVTDSSLDVSVDDFEKCEIAQYTENNLIPSTRSVRDASTNTSPVLFEILKENYTCSFCGCSSLDYPGEVAAYVEIGQATEILGNEDLSDFPTAQEPPKDN